jgi:hypothetical protein
LARHRRSRQVRVGTGCYISAKAKET